MYGYAKALAPNGIDYSWSSKAERKNTLLTSLVVISVVNSLCVRFKLLIFSEMIFINGGHTLIRIQSTARARESPNNNHDQAPARSSVVHSAVAKERI
jgi:hypothetical protein